MNVTEKLKQLLFDGDAGGFPFDRVGLVCLAWTGLFVAVTAVLSFTL